MASTFITDFMTTAAPYLASRFSQPVPTQLVDEYLPRLATAQTARGSKGPAGLTGEDSTFLFGLAEQSRMNLLQPDLKLASIAAKQNQFQASQAQQQANWQQNFTDVKAAGKSQSDFAQQYFDWLRSQVKVVKVPNPQSGGTAGGGGQGSMYVGSAFTGASM